VGLLALLCVMLAANVAHADNSSPSSSGSSSGGTETQVRKRYDPGLAFWAMGDVRGYEDLNGAATSAGVGVGYSWDLVGLRAEFLQGIGIVGEHRPTFLKLTADYAFATIQSFSIMGRVGLNTVLNGPNCQLNPASRVGATCQEGPSPNLLIGPELGMGVRYRLMPKFDIFAAGTIQLVNSVNGTARFFFNPGGTAGVTVHPFGSED
jgi:hypothetical protein